MISMLTRTARGERSTLDSIATPCSVNAYGSLRRPPRPVFVVFAVTDCDRKDSTSPSVSRNMKIGRKALPVPRHRLVERLDLDVVQRREINIDHDVVIANSHDQAPHSFDVDSSAGKHHARRCHRLGNATRPKDLPPVRTRKYANPEYPRVVTCARPSDTVRSRPTPAEGSSRRSAACRA